MSSNRTKTNAKGLRPEYGPSKATDALLNEAYPDEGQKVQIDDGPVKFLKDSVDLVDFCKTDKGKLEVW